MVIVSESSIAVALLLRRAVRLVVQPMIVRTTSARTSPKIFVLSDLPVSPLEYGIKTSIGATAAPDITVAAPSSHALQSKVKTTGRPPSR